MSEIVPKVVLKVNKDRLEVTWTCRGCGEQNICFTFSETISALILEIKNVDRVSCLGCCRTYEVD